MRNRNCTGNAPCKVVSGYSSLCGSAFSLYGGCYCDIDSLVCHSVYREISQGMHEFTVDVFRWTLRVNAYAFLLLTDNIRLSGCKTVLIPLIVKKGRTVASSFAMNTTFVLKIEISGLTFRFYIDVSEEK